ncbi:hypothetical protein ACG02S_25955 [Roseateles sp. DC23W]|uniref:Uncharacterized protein n=1 Tax=Pelomonas dachongensis TaxID=3299029 RepID=A0ABW7EV14_9BURK
MSNVCPTTELDSECIEELPLNEIAPRVSEFIARLSPGQLASIYWQGARLWMDTADGEMRISFGPPRHPGAHPKMDDEEPTVGHWVWFGLEYDTAEEHPLDDDGYRADDWPGVADWMREDLGHSAAWIAQMLQQASEFPGALS